MVVSGQLNALADLLPENNASTHRIAGWVGPIAGLDVFGEEKYLFALTEFEPRIVQPPA